MPIPAVGAEFFEVSRTPELQRTLSTLAWVLGGFAALTVLGRARCSAGGPPDGWSRRWTTSPARPRASPAGDLRNRLPTTEDPDLVTLVGSFNAMVDALTERIERDAGSPPTSATSCGRR